MSLLRTAGYWLLALALIANAGLPSAASAMDRSARSAHEGRAQEVAASADARSPCHQAAPAEAATTPDPVPMDCCDDASCACSCIQHAPVLGWGESRLIAPRHGGLAQWGRLASLPLASAAPAIRPPIA